jgi:hypothetical protein
VVSNTGCKKVTLIFARGTGESATMGTVVGPGLASNLRIATGNAAVQGVDYPADSAVSVVSKAMPCCKALKLTYRTGQLEPGRLRRPYYGRAHRPSSQTMPQHSCKYSLSFYSYQ